MPIAAFIAVNLAGTLTRLYVIRVLGVAFASPIERLLDVLAEYRVPLLILAAVPVLGSMWSDRRKAAATWLPCGTSGTSPWTTRRPLPELPSRIA